ncbi:DUF4238 domain-containing protein [Chryseobacterium sp. BIGb0232]|uniref:DUF4238 domain-containing protein n=1 Tax=Chryseobacterium sp. BIGb0232 TaxID=2940598 RepID=UPI000F46E98A|nr:DUF4238 domain-containing protein [Chryseobacterium sp. BIGb0232]MCS4300895.1 hypothetical protein [Chryseobacterium sp. BIGb0232]ROS20234.1 uncharacterized protein DUF4238 [Chryseobacterium nakagawai]
MSRKELTRNNHYVPQWYQRGFSTNSNQLHYLDLSPKEKLLPDGRVIKLKERKLLPFSQCFFEYDLYTTFFGPIISDIIERELFGKIDDFGSRAVRAFIDGTESDRHFRFQDLFRYIDAQKSRTPKGLLWLKNKYSHLNQTQLMMEMEAIQDMHTTIWYESVKEIVSAENSVIKFLATDHPVTTYNYACPISNQKGQDPIEPSIALKASQTIFPLNKNYCLILTNYEYAEQPELNDPLQKRTNARHFGETMVRTNAFIRNRKLNDHQVQEINFILKKSARRYIAAAEKEWLYPENDTTISWESVQRTLLPPEEEIFEFGGEMFAGYSDGRTYRQDAFGRTVDEHEFLKKPVLDEEPQPDDFCPCGLGKSYTDCCRDKPESLRPSWSIRSIRERNLIFYNGIVDILGLSRGKDWEDIRRELNDQQVKDIHTLFEIVWPVHTDIFKLLPKPDGKLRAVYTGIIDWQIISTFSTTAALYFDQLIVHNPFNHPTGMNPQYSPVANPSIYKQQTLKNVALFLEIFPLVDSGRIILLPDLGIFSRHLQSQVVEMARNRHSGGISIDDDEYKIFRKLTDDDLQRAIWQMSEEQQKQQIRSAFPNAGENYVNEVFEYSQQRRNEDPLALLQDDLLNGSGQLRQLSMGPNFEITLLLAQATGAIIFTNNLTRWKEILNAQQTSELGKTTQWSQLVDVIQGSAFPFTFNPETAIALDEADKLKKMRELWQKIYSTIGSTKAENITESCENITKQLIEAIVETKKEILQISNSESIEDSEISNFDAKFNIIIPYGGIQDNNVLRLLLTSGADHYLKSSSIAIFAQPIIKK